jgi:hypothetical protein
MSGLHLTCQPRKRWEPVSDSAKNPCGVIFDDPVPSVVSSFGDDKFMQDRSVLRGHWPLQHVIQAPELDSLIDGRTFVHNGISDVLSSYSLFHPPLTSPRQGDIVWKGVFLLSKRPAFPPYLISGEMENPR